MLVVSWLAIECCSALCSVEYCSALCCSVEHCSAVVVLLCVILMSVVLLMGHSAECHSDERHSPVLFCLSANSAQCCYAEHHNIILPGALLSVILPGVVLPIVAAPARYRRVFFRRNDSRLSKTIFGEFHLFYDFNLIPRRRYKTFFSQKKTRLV